MIVEISPGLSDRIARLEGVARNTAPGRIPLEPVLKDLAAAGAALNWL